MLGTVYLMMILLALFGIIQIAFKPHRVIDPFTATIFFYTVYLLYFASQKGIF